jgi:hypothetical protein
MSKIIIINTTYHLQEVTHFVGVLPDDVFFLIQGTLTLENLSQAYPNNRIFSEYPNLYKYLHSQLYDFTQIILCAENYLPNIQIALKLKRLTNCKLNILEDGAFATLFANTYTKPKIKSIKELIHTAFASFKCRNYVSCNNYHGERFYMIRDKLISNYFISFSSRLARSTQLKVKPYVIPHQRQQGAPTCAIIGQDLFNIDGIDEKTHNNIIQHVFDICKYHYSKVIYIPHPRDICLLAPDNEHIEIIKRKPSDTLESILESENIQHCAGFYSAALYRAECLGLSTCYFDISEFTHSKFFSHIFSTLREMGKCVKKIKKCQI